MNDSQRPMLLEAHSLGRRHPDGRGWLLDDVSIAVGRGDRVALGGPSGSGKTLLLRCLALLDPADQGQVLWEGSPPRRDAIPEFRSRAIYLHQRSAMTEDRVEAALQRPYQLGVHRRRAYDRPRIVEWLGRLQRDPSFLDKRAGDLSGGEIQLVALLRAVQLDPEVLLLDEPTSALDPTTTEAVEAWLAEWIDEAPQRRAYAWVTHDARQADRVGSVSVRMAGGRIV